MLFWDFCRSPCLSCQVFTFRFQKYWTLQEGCKEERELTSFCFLWLPVCFAVTLTIILVELLTPTMAVPDSVCSFSNTHRASLILLTHTSSDWLVPSSSKGTLVSQDPSSKFRDSAVAEHHSLLRDLSFNSAESFHPSCWVWVIVASFLGSCDSWI